MLLLLLSAMVQTFLLCLFSFFLPTSLFKWWLLGTSNVPLHSCITSHDTISFFWHTMSLHNTSIHESVYANKINLIHSKSLFVKYHKCHFKVCFHCLSWKVGLILKRGNIQVYWINMLWKYACLSGRMAEPIMSIFQTAWYITLKRLVTLYLKCKFCMRSE